jgi:hypothetical protein
MKVKLSISVRQWVLPIGFAISKHQKSIYVFCIGIDFFDVIAGSIYALKNKKKEEE